MNEIFNRKQKLDGKGGGAFLSLLGASTGPLVQSVDTPRSRLTHKNIQSSCQFFKHNFYCNSEIDFYGTTT